MDNSKLGLFSRCFRQRLVLCEFVREGSKVSALRTLSAPIVLTPSELMFFAKIALAVQGILPFGGRGGATA